MAAESSRSPPGEGAHETLHSPLLHSPGSVQRTGHVPHPAEAAGTGTEREEDRTSVNSGMASMHSMLSRPSAGSLAASRRHPTDASHSAASEPASLEGSSGMASGGRSTLAVIQCPPTVKEVGGATPKTLPSARDTGTITSDGGEGRDAGKRTVGVLGLALLAYLTVCAGPYGIEDAVSAAGPGPVLLGVVLLGLLWGLPQALITAELSCMMDVNGSYVLWVERGLGPGAAWVSSFNSALSNACDTPLYCILLSTYVNSLVVSATGEPLPMWAQIALRCLALAIMLSANLRGMETVQGGAVVVVVAVLLPFVLQPIVGWHFLSPSTWVAARPAADIEWSVLCSVLLWNYAGFDAMGAIAGEIKDAKRTYVLGIAMALGLTVLTYLVPVATNAGVNRDYSTWTDGSLASMATRVAPWLGVWVVVGACLAQLGNGLTMLANSSRVLWQMAHRRMLPRSLGWTWAAFGTPAAALAAQSVVTAVLMVVGDFPTLVVFDTFFNNISLMLESVAFLRLRYIEANTHRPFLVPGGMVVAWGLTLAKGAVLVFAFVSISSWTVWAIAVGLNALIVAGYFAVTRCRRADLQASAGALRPGEEDALLLSEV